MDALIAVDVQNDFCPGGALGVPDGDAVIPRVNELARQIGPGGLVIATRDWHPADHQSFAAAGGPWPVHCVQGTPGAELHPGVDRELIDVVIDKGQAPELDGYSGFERTGLEARLRESGVDTVHVAGLALDYCVRATALDAKRAGFNVILHRDATRAVNASPGDDERALADLREAAVEIVG